MRTRKTASLLTLLALLALFGGIGATGLLAAGAGAPPREAPPGGGQAPTVLADALEQIRVAPDGVATMTALARAVGAFGDSVAIQQAYHRRMSELGLPIRETELAHTDLWLEARGDGMLWRVRAYICARRGNHPAALACLDRTMKAGFADDPIVLRTAGQLLARGDLRTELPAYVFAPRRSTGGVIYAEGPNRVYEDSIRAAMKDRPAFQEAYRQARDFYTQTKASIVPGEFVFDAAAPNRLRGSIKIGGKASHVTFRTVVRGAEVYSLGDIRCNIDAGTTCLVGGRGPDVAPQTIDLVVEPADPTPQPIPHYEILRWGFAFPGVPVKNN
jgi:hypothetical protein